MNIKQTKETKYEILLDQEEYDYLRFVFNKFYNGPLAWPKEGGVYRMQLWDIFNQFNEIPNQSTPNKNLKLKDSLIANSPITDFGMPEKTND